MNGSGWHDFVQSNVDHGEASNEAENQIQGAEEGRTTKKDQSTERTTSEI